MRLRDIIICLVCVVLAIGLFILVPDNVPDLPVFKPAEQIHGLLKKGSEMLAFHSVLAINLFDEQFAVAENDELFGTNLLCSFDSFYETCIFGHVVRGSTQDRGSCLQLSTGGIVQDEPRSGRARIASAAAICVYGDLLNRLGQFISTPQKRKR